VSARDPHLLDALEGSELPAPVGGIVWRQVLDPTSALRPNLRGARFNPLGVEALYCSLDPDTAAAEIDHLIAQQPVPITRVRRSFGIRVHLSRVADLRPTPWGRPFQYNCDLTDWEQCQTIGAAAAWLGIAGLIVPSIRHDADNLVVFVGNLDLDDVVDTVDDGHEYPPGPPDAGATPLEMLT
jgi:RES domain-containing protein